ncbi:MAG: C1 family peptidase [Bacteroidales bacterium]|nr:C1 family peptidase [Bacteroidales bacterium]
MKKLMLCGMAALMATSAMAQEEAKKDSVEGFQFTTVDSVAITPVKNQKNAGTCWCYSGMSFLESEILKKGGPVVDLSEMYVVLETYMDRAEKAVRTHGDVSFSQGGSFEDMIMAIKKYGLMPDAEMPAGVMYGDTLSNHSELSKMTDPMVAAAAKSRKLQMAPDGEWMWKKAVRAVHETYLGKAPKEFTFQGKTYTPQSFVKYLKLDAKDYAMISSFTHHPYSMGENIGEQFVVEVQDNWRWGTCFNLELDDMMKVIDDAIKNGYTIGWGGDVSEEGFTRDGLGVYPDVEAADGPGADQARWLKLDPTAKRKELTQKPLTQKVVTPEERQKGYDNFETGDDHGMHIFGIAKDQEGNKYYMVKNSWGKTGKYNGIWYMTPEYIRAKTIDFVVNKNAISKDLRKKYGIN